MNQLWVRILFVVSLVLNVFLIGTAVGVMTIGRHLAHDRGPPPGGGQGALWRASQSLPPEQARAFRQAMRREAMAMRPQAEANRRARQDAWRMGMSDPFDAAAVKAALARSRTGDVAARAQLEERLVDLAAALPPEQRHAVFRAMADPPPRPMHRGFRGPPPGEPGPEGPPP